MRVIGSQCISTSPVFAPCAVAAMVASILTVCLPESPWALRRRGRPSSPSSRRAPFSPGLLIAGGQVAAAMPPLGLRVERLLGDAAQLADDRSRDTARHRGDPGPRRLVHERHELVRKARHGAADADAADVRA